MRGQGDEPVAACGAWTAEDTYEVRVCYYEGELGSVFRFHYASGELHWRWNRTYPGVRRRSQALPDAWSMAQRSCTCGRIHGRLGSSPRALR